VPVTGAGARVCVWEGGSVWIGRSAEPDKPHGHQAIQVTIALTGQVRVRGRTAEWSTERAVIVPRNVKHAFDRTASGLVATIFVDPESPEGESLAVSYPGPGLHQPRAGRAEAAAALILSTWGQTRAPVRLIDAARRALEAVGATRLPRRALDPRVQKAIDLLKARLGDHLTPTKVAKEVELPADRLAELFAESTGLPLRNYLLWLRLGRAFGALGTGRSTAQVAAESGFAGAAELNRTFVRVFGIAPSALGA